MEIIRYTDADYAARLQQLIERPPVDPEVERAVAAIVEQVRAEGDAGLMACARRFDGVDLSPEQFRVSEVEIAAACRSIPPRLRQAIRAAHRQIRDFSSQRRPQAWHYSPRIGVTLGERFAPLSRVACYVPGGTAPLISTVLHTVTLAAVAGVKEIVVVTPPGRDGVVHPALLYAARQAGASEIYRLGGAYGIAAMAFGTESIRKVEKIVGPGNAFVTAAKRQVYGHVALDMVAGPSEIMVLADDSAPPAFIAADMLSQIEHGSGREHAVLVTDCAALLPAVEAELRHQVESRQRGDCIRRCLEHGTHLLLVDSLESGIEIANCYAPEHLEIMARSPGRLARQVTAAGAIFLGPWTPEPVGDFVAGPSHVLPTGGAARYFSGLTVDQFYRRMSVVEYSQPALARELEMIVAFTKAEGLDAHGHSAKVRRPRLKAEVRKAEG